MIRTALARRHRWWWLVMAGTSCLVPPVSAQIPETLPSAIGARVHAQAGAVTTEANDVTGMFWNPATIALLQQPEVVVGALHAPQQGFEHAGLVFSLHPSPDNVFGAAVQTSRFRASGEVPRSEEFRRIDLASALGTRLTSTIAGGVMFQARRLWSRSSERWTGFVSGGFLYSPSEEIAYALVFRNVGRGIALTTRVGARDSVAFSLYEPRPVLHVAATMRFPSSRFRRLLNVTLANEKHFGEPGIRYMGAFEMYATRSISFRLGARVMSNTVGFHCGFGYAFEAMSVDYSYAAGSLMPRLHEVTFNIALGPTSRDSGSDAGFMDR